MSQQACGRDALVDYLSRYRRLDQCFTLATGPFSTHMLLDREHTWRVIELLTDVFADALKLTAASALSVFWLMMDDGAWELRRQWRTFGLLTWLGGCCWRIDRLQLSFQSRNIEWIVEQGAGNTTTKVGVETENIREDTYSLHALGGCTRAYDRARYFMPSSKPLNVSGYILSPTNSRTRPVLAV